MIFWGLYTDKNENKMFLIYKEIQMGSGAQSYRRKGFLIYDFAPVPSEFSHIWGKFNFIFYQYTMYIGERCVFEWHLVKNGLSISSVVAFINSFCHNLLHKWALKIYLRFVWHITTQIFVAYILNNDQYNSALFIYVPVIVSLTKRNFSRLFYSTSVTFWRK